jgi:hypothetical protein
MVQEHVTRWKIPLLNILLVLREILARKSVMVHVLLAQDFLSGNVFNREDVG